MNRNYTLTTTVRTDVEVMSLTEENTVDLHSVGTVPYQSRRVGEKHLDPVKNKLFTVPSNTSTLLYLQTATCFGR